MDNPKNFIILVLFCWFSQAAFAQPEDNELMAASEEVNTEIAHLLIIENTSIDKTEKQLPLTAKIWPNPSNLGKVNLSVANLPKEPVYFQVFNEKSELIQEGILKRESGTSIQQILKFSDDKGNYSIKLSDSKQILQALELTIL